MRMNEWITSPQDDLLDESTIELFRHYLKEALKSSRRRVFTSLTWADN
jgi:hypothetical protein